MPLNFRNWPTSLWSALQEEFVKLLANFVDVYLLIAFYINNKFEGARRTVEVFVSSYMINFNVKTGPQPLAFVWREFDERSTQTF